MTRRAGRAASAQILQRFQTRRSGTVVFSSFSSQYSDNPRAIAEELRHSHPGVAEVWAGSPGTHPFPADAALAPVDSLAFLRQVGRAGHLVANGTMPGNIFPSKKMRYIQTWHGTPLKRIGYDNDQWSANPAGLRRFADDVRKWDYLISQNPFSSDVFRRAFRFEGELLETGYPRNDALTAPDRDRVGERVRRELGIPDATRTILYAPTWRDNLVERDGRHAFALALDLDAIERRFGDDVAVLVRLHHVLDPETFGVPGGHVRNVSAWPDIRELYLAADVLVTDYSSAMFDFAVTGKPIVLFAYDLAEYRDSVRGFYFDLEDEAPGPVCATSDEVVSVIAALDDVHRGFAERYARFRARYCPWDDGGAAARVVERAFGPAVEAPVGPAAVDRPEREATR
jgi:CDP-glycerol glycerophosphotransferase